MTPTPIAAHARSILRFTDSTGVRGSVLVFLLLCVIAMTGVPANAALIVGSSETLEAQSQRWLDLPVEKTEKVTTNISMLAKVFNPPSATSEAILGVGIDPNQVVSWSGNVGALGLASGRDLAAPNKARIEALAQALDPVNVTWRIDARSGALVLELERPLRAITAAAATTPQPVVLASSAPNALPGLMPQPTVATKPLSALPPVPAPVVTPVPVIPTWEVKTSDVTLSASLDRWAKSAGYTVKWDAEKHFLIDAPNTIKASFEVAVNTVLSSPGILLSDYPLEACFYPNTPPLLRITKLGDQKNQCQ